MGFGSDGSEYVTFDDVLTAWNAGDECGGVVVLVAAREMAAVPVKDEESVWAIWVRVPDRLKPALLQCLAFRKSGL